jgi:hypothetical protein
LEGNQISLSQLPEVNEDAHISPIPQAVLEKRVKNKKGECQVHWQGLSPAEATWEDMASIQEKFPSFFLADKENARGEG